MTYENPWIFNGKIFDDENVVGFVGFVYLITNIATQEKYIGRKYFDKVRKHKGQRRRKRSSSDWKTYYSSSERLKADVKKYGASTFRREIISIHTTRGMVNFSEIVEQFNRRVLDDDTYINDCIGKWRRIPKHIQEKSVYCIVNSSS